MKKWVFTAFRSVLVFCFTLHVAHAMEEGEKKVSAHPGHRVIKSKKVDNKEYYHLRKDNFSTGSNVNFSGLYQYIHYTFKNETLLTRALHPLLPQKLQGSQQGFEHLEFLGDSILGLIIRQRILQLFPNEERGMHVKLYEALTCNKTLSEVYLHNLDIEPYLPYPGERECLYCNVVEAMVAAISLDNPDNELVQPRKFIMRIIDDKLLVEKRDELLKNGKIKIKTDSNKMKSSFILPNLKETIEEVFQNPSIDQKNTKSLLGMILEKTLQDQPQYVLSLGKDEKGMPVFVVNVIGAQIGHKITGVGFTRFEAEQNAAQKAINFLAQNERLPERKLASQAQCYTDFMSGYCGSKEFKIEELEVLSQNVLSVPIFTYQVKSGNVIIGEGEGGAKAKAQESAAKKACYFLIEKGLLKKKSLEEDRNYRSILKEWMDQGNIVEYLEIKKDLNQPLTEFKFRIKIDEDIMGEGTGPTKKVAKENAYRAAFEQLLKKQEDARKEKENRKKLAKKALKGDVLS